VASRKIIPNRDSGQIEQNGGTVPVLIPAKLLKIMVKVMEVNKGCIKYQSGPKTVCLYIPSISLEKHKQITVLPNFLEVQRKEFVLGVISNNHSVVLFSCSCIGSMLLIFIINSLCMPS
jgi:hypothetical protein